MTSLCTHILSNVTQARVSNVAPGLSPPLGTPNPSKPLDWPDASLPEELDCLAITDITDAKKRAAAAVGAEKFGAKSSFLSFNATRSH